MTYALKYYRISMLLESATHSWRNWQTRKTKDLVGDHAGSTPVECTKNIAQTFVCAIFFFCAEDAGVEERKVSEIHRRQNSGHPLSFVCRVYSATPVEHTISELIRTFKRSSCYFYMQFLLDVRPIKIVSTNFLFLAVYKNTFYLRKYEKKL